MGNTRLCENGCGRRSEPFTSFCLSCEEAWEKTEEGRRINEVGARALSDLKANAPRWNTETGGWDG